MARTGLKSLIVLVFCATLPAHSLSAAGPSDPKKKGGFGTLYYGEDPGQTDPIGPEQGDYQQSGSMQGGQKPATGTPLPSATTPGVAPQTESAASVSAKPAASGGPAAFPYSQRPQAAPAPAAVWPGPKRPSATPAAKPVEAGASAGPQVTVQGEKLRDAPAPTNPHMYSLWAGLSTPLLLPSADVKTLSADKAKDLGSVDYENRILGDRAVLQSGTVVSAGEPQAGVSGSALNGSEKGAYVLVELSVAGTPGDSAAALARVTAAGDLRVDERYPPSFMDPGRTRVLVHGWLPVEHFAQVMTSEGVTRVEIERSALTPPTDTGSTDLLLGLRIPPDSRPNIAMRDAVLRLASNAHFELQGMIGYQAIPGSNEIVMIVSGRAPVREMGRIMADPSVVKVAPRPSDDRAKAAGRKAPRPLDRILPPALVRHPAFLLVLILLTAFLLKPLVVRRH